MKESLTKSDVEKIQAEIEERKVHTRHELLEDVKEARAQGDLSENFEYYAAKKAKNRNESRIRYLERMLKNAVVVDDQSAADEVGMNNSFTIYIPEDDEEETYRLVTSVRADSMENRISIDSPLGKAVKGHKVGDTITVKVNDNYSYEAVIRSIDKTNDESGDSIRQF